MNERTVSRLILKENDVLVLHLPTDYFRHREIITSIYKQIRERLLDAGKKNKILMIPQDVHLGVIGSEEIKEHVSNVDLWHLFDEEGGELQ
jgi:hypothetical protein